MICESNERIERCELAGTSMKKLAGKRKLFLEKFSKELGKRQKGPANH